MGWKNVKTHYRIEHTVQVTEAGICIGSPYIHNIIVIGQDGTITRSYTGQNDDLVRYQKEFNDDPETLKRLIQEPDIFEASVQVFTYKGGEILEKQCEALGWPNVTHDGQIMHDNTFSPVKAQVVKWAKEEAAAVYEWTSRNVADAHQKLTECHKAQHVAEQNILKLETDYPNGTIAQAEA